MDARLLPTGLCLALVLLACRSAGDKERTPQTHPAAETGEAAPPWTSTFMEPAALVAREVRIEGPPGLLAHVAVRQDEDVATSHRTVPEGHLQEYQIKSPGVGEIRAQLDKLAIAAEVRLTVLERPGPVAVTVVAEGDAMWRSTAGAERASPTLRLVGDAPR